MDAVADAVNGKGEKPPFYYAEQSQQNNYQCDECGSANDVLGKFAYCSVCGTRNELQEFAGKTLPDIRKRLNNADTPERCAQDCVSAFDTIAGQLIEQLIARVPMTEARRNKLAKRFHNLEVIAQDLKEIFDINILQNVPPEDVKFAKVLFFRRHLYEYRGGEADQKYIEESGDTDVRLKQVLHESRQSVHRLANIVNRIISNFHAGFHSIIPRDEGPIFCRASQLGILDAIYLSWTK